jgi:Skp family chaperone for outer membrane proteins
MLRFAKFALAAAVVSAAAFSSFASAQAAAGKVYLVNLRTVLDQSKENTDLGKATQARIALLRSEGEQRASKINAEAERINGTLKAGTAEYETAIKDLRRAQIEAKLAEAVAQDEVSRTVKTNTRKMLDKVVATVETIAKENGAALVLNDIRPPTFTEAQFDQMSMNDYQQVISNRTIVYASPEADITNAVVARLDASYTAPAGAPAAAPQ